VELKPGRWHLHHLTYRHAGKERLDEVQAICLACHRLAHPDKKILSAKGIQAEKRKKLKAAKTEAREKKRRERRIRSAPYRFPVRHPVCPTCGGKLSRAEHERQCLGIDARKVKFAK
jgi:hypothetical protein